MSQATDTQISPIRAAREAAGLTQIELSAAAGIAHPSALSTYERGLRPSPTVLARIAAALNVDAEDLQ